MKVSDILTSKYLKAADLQDKEPTVIIARYDMEKLGEDNKVVLYFRGKEKGLACNATNLRRIEYMYGDEMDEWVGKEIKLYTELVTFQGKTGPALRVKPPAKRGDPGYVLSSGGPNGPQQVKAQAPADPDLDDVIPF